MTISEETLMAFADGELDAAARAAVEVAMREDPELEKRIARHRAMRKRLQAAFADELSQPVPQRWLSLVRESPAAKTSNVVDLQEARAASARAAQTSASSRRNDVQQTMTRTSWRQLGSMAAAVLLGLGIGYGLSKQGAVPIVHGASGALVANGQLASALSSQLAAEQTGSSAVRIGVSYVAKSGEYCRTFSLAGAKLPTAAAAQAAAAGVACKDHQQWQIRALAQVPSQPGGNYRTAGTAVSPVILKLIEDEIQGEPLDAAGESAARQRGWQSPK
jgi:anti-sigma factor RsiW